MSPTNLLEWFESDKPQVRFIGVDTAWPEVLVEQLGALWCVAAGLAGWWSPGEWPTERWWPWRWTLTAGAATCRRRRRRRTECLHWQTGATCRLVSGLDTRVDWRFVTERTSSERRRNNTRHRRVVQTVTHKSSAIGSVVNRIQDHGLQMCSVVWFHHHQLLQQTVQRTLSYTTPVLC